MATLQKYNFSHYCSLLSTLGQLTDLPDTGTRDQTVEEKGDGSEDSVA